MRWGGGNEEKHTVYCTVVGDVHLLIHPKPDTDLDNNCYVLKVYR